MACPHYKLCKYRKTCEQIYGKCERTKEARADYGIEMKDIFRERYGANSGDKRYRKRLLNR